MVLSKYWLDFLFPEYAQNATSHQQQPHARNDRVRNCATCNDRLIVAKHPQWTIKGNTKRTERTLWINHMLSSLSSYHELGTIGCSFDLTLLFAEPINRRLVNKFQNATGGSPRNHIVHQVSIKEGSVRTEQYNSVSLG